MDFPVLVNDFSLGIDDKKAGEKCLFEIAVVFECRCGNVDFISFRGVADDAGFLAGDLNGDFFNHLLDRIAVIMRMGIKGNELVWNIMAKVGMPNRGMCNLAGPDEIIDHVLPIEAFLDPRLNYDRRILGFHSFLLRAIFNRSNERAVHLYCDSETISKACDVTTLNNPAASCGVSELSDEICLKVVTPEMFLSGVQFGIAWIPA